MKKEKYTLKDGREFVVPYNRCDVATITRDLLEEFIAEFDKAHEQAKQLQTIIENLEEIKAKERRNTIDDFVNCFQCKGNPCEKEIRADERRKVLHEQRALDVNFQISAEELRADERRKTITEIEEIFLSFKYVRPEVFQFVSIDSVLKKLEQMKEQGNG